ncbi:hypothetical protein GCM10011380_12370 [Sphingomonas metalli]|jgi:hypothetical protein|uniref:Uncharacterized protein n=1 Tax=Sphingomonas metalli TaxID=1779358 RepID=A0A916WS00_9SPHN|nr:hypothetical protein [Sphingomonas metalli]GGB24350.1 hypothetical protein GCM10011380_12370 [Sphingomonas metalli]
MNSIETQTASNWANGSLWLIVVFIGAFVLVGAMAWARSRNRAIPPEQERRTEQATRDLYQNPKGDEPGDR